MGTNESQKLAEKIVKILESASGSNDLASLYASIEKINHRLDKLETMQNKPTEEKVVTHPSLDRFSIAEAIADAIIAGKEKEKACTFEPNDRPCDHCSMCSSRGF
jgi:hypothetical protein